LIDRPNRRRDLNRLITRRIKTLRQIFRRIGSPEPCNLKMVCEMQIPFPKRESPSTFSPMGSFQKTVGATRRLLNFFYRDFRGGKRDCSNWLVGWRMQND
jgi:hypothetical protein